MEFTDGEKVYSYYKLNMKIAQAEPAREILKFKHYQMMKEAQSILKLLKGNEENE